MFSWRSLLGGKSQAQASPPALAVLTLPLLPQTARPVHLETTAAPPFGRIAALHLETPEFDELRDTIGVPGSPDYYEISGVPGQPTLGLVRQKVQDRPDWQLWEVQAGKKPVLLRQRPLRLAPDQPDWLLASLTDVACLPAGRLLVGMAYWIKAASGKPSQHRDLFVFDLGTGRSQLLVRDAEPGAYGVPGKPALTEAGPLGPTASLVVHHSGRVRLAPEVYSSATDHLLLFSAQRPDGVEIARIPREQGKVREWGMVRQSLWITTRTDTPQEAPKPRYWSLDLTPLL